MTDTNETESAARILLVNLDKDDEEHVRNLLDGAVKQEVIKRV